MTDTALGPIARAGAGLAAPRPWQQLHGRLLREGGQEPHVPR